MGNPILGELSTARARISRFYSSQAWIEGRAEDQLAQVAAWPGRMAFEGFPDLHPGRCGPVGASFLADRIWPQLVGPDIGCGMALWRLDLLRHRLKIDRAVRRLAVLDGGADPEDAASALAAAGIEGLIAADGLGSIGGGNHFGEVQAFEEVNDPNATSLRPGDLCLLVHSGSRGWGAQTFEGHGDSRKQG